jgi:hypothetical protein
MRHDPNCKGDMWLWTSPGAGGQRRCGFKSFAPGGVSVTGGDTRQSRMDGATPTYFILERTAWKRKGGTRVLRMLLCRSDEEKKPGEKWGPNAHVAKGGGRRGGVRSTAEGGQW